MARIEHTTEGRIHTLSARNVVGRSRRCDLRIRDSAVSGEHATIWWGEGGWQIRDLGSRNGTLCGDARLNPGAARGLAVGDTLTFGRPEHTWRVVDLAPPIAFASPIDGGPMVLSVDSQLALPSADEPEALIARDAEGRWLLETDRSTQTVEDLHTLQLASGAWRLHLPEEEDGTVDASSVLRPGGEPERIELLFRVSLDEEYVELRCRVGGREIDLGTRVHHYLLLTLARERLADAENPELPPSSHGWVHIEDLTRMLRAEEAHINVQIFRARKQIVKAELASALVLVERRPRARQLRLGVDRLRVETI